VTRRPAAAAAAVAAALALAAGCGSGGTPAPPPPDQQEEAGSGYFVGTAPGGLGATVDLLGTDPAVRALGPVLAAETTPGEPAPSVGIASVVNDSSRVAPMPDFVAVLGSGRRIPLQPAAAALRGRDDAAARRAASLLPAPRSSLPAGAGAVEYVVLRGVVPGRVAEVRMSTGPEASTRLAPRPR
jgi:hypothetical protein